MSGRLVDEFHSKLEEGLILAIGRDYDLDNPEEFETARRVLLELAKNVPNEEASGFAADGAGPNAKEVARDSSSSTDPTSSHRAFQRQEPSGTDQSVDESCLYSDDAAGGERVEISRVSAFDHESEDAKFAQLASMFPRLELRKIGDALKRAAGDFPAAMDELLAVVYVEETEEKTPAIDAFFKPEDENDGSQSRSKKKKKKKKRRGKNRCGAQSSTADRGGDLGEKEMNDILFLTERLDIPHEMATAAYLESGRSQAAATVVILDDYIREGVEAQGEHAQGRLRNLQRDHKHVPIEYLSSIIQVAGPIEEWQNDVASLLNKHFSEKEKGPLSISYTLTPIEDEVEDGYSVVTSKKGLKSRQGPGSTLSRGSQAASSNRVTALGTSASASPVGGFRMGKSGPVYSQTNSVSSSNRIMELRQMARQARTEAAHQLVNQRRTENSIDLHGVTVNDGVRIALDSVRSWYDNLDGEYKAREAKKGYTVITGRGLHSQGGVSLLRKALLPQLVNAGWNVQVGTGVFTIYGRLQK